MNSKLVDQAREMMKGVVQIHAEGYIEDDLRSLFNPSFASPSSWSGSGFFVSVPHREGYIVTNAHVVRNASKVEIMSMLTSEERFVVEVVGLVETLDPDLALLKLEGKELERFKSLAIRPIKYLKLSDREKINRGIEIKAIGYPLGMVEPNISGGEITNFISGSKESTERLVTDAAINPGNSGGPAVCEDGTVIGVNTAIILNAENIGFITPASFVKIVVENFLKKHKMCFSHLGAELQKNSPVLSHYLGQDHERGVVVKKVYEGGSLDRAGIVRGDVILSIDEQKFDRHGILLEQDEFRHRNIFDIFRLIPVGKNVSIEYFHDREVNKVQVKTYPFPRKGVRSRPILFDRQYVTVFGMILQELSLEIVDALQEINVPKEVFYEAFKTLEDREACVMLTHIYQGSQADKMEWSLGEIISEIEGKKIYTLKDIIQILSEQASLKKEGVLIETRTGAIGYFNLSELKKPLELKRFQNEFFETESITSRRI